MKSSFYLLSCLVVGALALGCITGPEGPAPREMGDVDYPVMEGAELPDGTEGPGAADPRAQDDLDKNRDEHEEAVKENREASKKVDSEITKHVAKDE